MEQIILQKLGWDKDYNKELELIYYLKEDNYNIGTLHIINLNDLITIEFKPINQDLFKYLIVYDKPQKQFDLSKSTFKLDNNNYLNFLDTLGRKIFNQEKSYLNT